MEQDREVDSLGDSDPLRGPTMDLEKGRSVTPPLVEPKPESAIATKEGKGCCQRAISTKRLRELTCDKSDIQQNLEMV